MPRAQRECQRAHDRPAPACVGAIVSHHPHAEQRHAGGPAARGPGIGEVGEPPDRIHDDHPDVALFQAMSLPVSTLAANEMAARASMNTPRLTPHVHSEDGKTRCETRALPCRPSWMGAGGRGIARPRSHDAALVCSPSAGPGGPVYGRRRRRSDRPGPAALSHLARKPRARPPAPRRPAAVPPRAGRAGPPPSAVIQTDSCAWPFVVRSLTVEAGAGHLAGYGACCFSGRGSCPFEVAEKLAGPTAPWPLRSPGPGERVPVVPLWRRAFAAGPPRT